MTSTLSLKRSLAVSSNLSPSTAKRPRSDSDISSVSDTASEYSDSCNRTEFQSPRLSSVGYTVSPSWDEPQREHGQELNCDCPDKSDVFSVPTITVDVDEVCIGMVRSSVPKYEICCSYNINFRLNTTSTLRIPGSFRAFRVESPYHVGYYRYHHHIHISTCNRLLPTRYRY